MNDQKKSEISQCSTETSVDEFLEQVEKLPVPKQSGEGGRLVFAMDATASRSPTWDIACDLQGQMFTETSAMGGLDIQLVYFRGFRECKSTKWISESAKLLRLMSSVTCLAGKTQIERVVKHTLAEIKAGSKVNALLYVGDCMEESADLLGDLAGQLGLSGVPMFIFQEGSDRVASDAFKQMAQLSGGAHCSLDRNSAAQLGELLRAVAVFASGGRRAFDEHCRLAGPLTQKIARQLK